MTVGSLFAGIGGFDLAFRRAGFEISWQVEIDPWCRRVLAKHFPEATRHEDIKECKNLPPVDVICGGFPCQPFSTVGRRSGANDNRYVWPEMHRVIREVQPSWVVAENVRGITSSKMAPIFEQVHTDLESEGYDVQSFILPACSVDAPHIRQRVWIIARRRGASSLADAYNEGVPCLRNSNRPIEAGANVPGVGRTNTKHNQKKQGHVLADAKSCGRDECEADRKHSCTQIQEIPGNGAGLQGELPRWTDEPGVGRVANGVPHRMDRLRGLGNAVVPQLVQVFAELIMEIEHQARRVAA